MSDDKSTPLAGVNNKKDDSKVVNGISSKYNNLQESPDGTLPSHILEDHVIKHLHKERRKRPLV